MDASCKLGCQLLYRCVFKIQEKGVSVWELKGLIGTHNLHDHVARDLPDPKGWRLNWDQHLAMKEVAYLLGRVLDVVLVDDVRRPLLLRPKNLDRHLVVVTMESLP